MSDRSASSTARRLGAAGASAAAAVFAMAPLAHADAKPRVADSTAPEGADRSESATGAVKADPVQPNYGLQKVRIGVQVKDGSWVPPGTTTAGSVVTIVDTPPEGDGAPSTSTCTTQADPTQPDGTATYCDFGNRAVAARVRAAVADDPLPLSAYYLLGPGHTLTLTQKSVASDALLLDKSSRKVEPCVLPTQPEVRGVAAADPPPCPTDGVPEVFDDPGRPPAARPDSATVAPSASVTIGVLGNDTTHGAPPTVEIVQPPAHGTATVVHQTTPAVRGSHRAAAAEPAIRYTPEAGFAGHDSLRYSLTTANGTRTATVSLLVAAPPTAHDDSAKTQAGDVVTIDVLANDLRNGGGALSIATVADPAHGTATIRNGQVAYTPDSGFTGTDTFTYVARNSLGTATATVTVTVTGVANTGTPTGELLALAVLLIGTGGVATAAGRRRYAARHASRPAGGA